MPKKKTKKRIARKVVKKSLPKPAPQPKKSSIKEISWKAPEWAQHSKTIVWWLGFFLIFCTLIGLFYYFNSWWGIIFVVLISAVIFSHSFRQPREILCKIDYKGIKIGTRFFEWQELVSFWLVPDMPYTLLYIQTTNKILSVISIEAPIDKAENIYLLLANRLAVEDRGEIPVDKLTRWLRF